MTRISVDTGQLSAAVGRAQALQRGAEQCARGVAAVQRGLDLQIAASQQIDARLGALTARLDAQSGSVGQHVGFLAHASARYEAAETAVCTATPRGQSPGGAPAGVSPAFRPPDQGFFDDGGARPAAWNDLIRALAKDLIGADADVQEGFVDLVGAVPVLGTFLTVDEIITSLENGDPGASAWDTFKMVATEGAERGFGVPGLATLVGLVESYSHFVLSGQFQNGVVDLLPDWAVTFLASDVNNGFVNAVTDVGEGMANVAQGAVEAAGDVWDWVNPW